MACLIKQTNSPIDVVGQCVVAQTAVLHNRRHGTENRLFQPFVVAEHTNSLLIEQTAEQQVGNIVLACGTEDKTSIGLFGQPCHLLLRDDAIREQRLDDVICSCFGRKECVERAVVIQDSENAVPCRFGQFLALTDGAVGVALRLLLLGVELGKRGGVIRQVLIELHIDTRVLHRGYLLGRKAKVGGVVGKGLYIGSVGVVGGCDIACYGAPVAVIDYTLRRYNGNLRNGLSVVGLCHLRS